MPRLHFCDRANEVARNTEKNKHLNGGNPGGDAGAGNSNKGGNNSNAGGNGPSTGSGQAGNGGNAGSNAGGNSGNTGGGVGSGNDNSGNGGGQTSGGAGQDSGGGDGREFIYFYHPDHLGSTGYVTDEKALRYEHIAYFPFGETWVQESSATWRVPYQFTSKEMDTETGLYYFGARYYDPRTSVWQSADPVLGKYLTGKGNGGVYNSLNVNLYTYSYNNPLGVIDPDGREGIVLSGQPGNHGIRTHFLENGLSRAIAMSASGKNTTWIIYAGGGSGAYNQNDIASYSEAAKKAGVNVVVAKNAAEVTGYINSKTGGDSRGKDKVTDLTYVGHGLAGQLAIDYNGSGDKGAGLSISGLSADAFASGADINLNASCNAATPSSNGSVLSQFAQKVDKNSTLTGVLGTVDFTTRGVDTDSQLLQGGLIKPKGATGTIGYPFRNWWGIGWESSRPVQTQGTHE